MKKIVMIDIDGCLTDYPQVFLDWVAENEGITYPNIETMKKTLSKERYEEIKTNYRLSGIKRTLPLIDGVKETLELIRQKGWIIWIATRRPHKHCFYDTKYWLDSNKIPYERLFLVDDKKLLLNKNRNIKIVVDDDVNFITWINENTNATGFVGDWNEIRKRFNTKKYEIN